MNIPEKIILNNPLNWILSWNEWITQFLNRYLPFLMISPLFCLFWTLFGQFLGTFPIRPVLIIPWLLNWIIFWIESPEFILNWIIFWIESWVKQYWIEYWMNHFLAKFKYWIESDWVSFTTTVHCLRNTTWKSKPQMSKGAQKCYAWMWYMYDICDICESMWYTWKYVMWYVIWAMPQCHNVWPKLLQFCGCPPWYWVKRLCKRMKLPLF